MKVAIVHYHLRKGGVTRVIENVISSLPEPEVDFCVLTGEAYEGDAIQNVEVVTGLGYVNSGESEDARFLAAEMFAKAKKQLGGPPDVWHIHNHSLGKNVCLPEAIHELLMDGARVLLQIHDFAEDGRPGNYARQRAYYTSTRDYQRHLYPRGSQIHYATLNSRDAVHLRSAGVYEALLHLLPNSVEPLPSEPPKRDPFPNQKVCLYPTRGIRRKNMGELFLLSALCGKDTVFLSTLGPENPEWQRIHQDWVFFGQDQHLPVRLAFGETGELSFPELIHRADTLITTSVAEGFGLAFLEPWLAGKTVVGRDLPAITRDFTQEGIQLDHLYDRLEVPAEWVDLDALRTAMAGGLEQSYESYGRSVPRNGFDRLWAETVQNGRVEFGRLNEALQQEAIRNCRPGEVETPSLEGCDPELVEINRNLIEDRYGRAGYGDTLRQVYHQVATSPLDEVTYHDPDAILSSFLRPEDFMLLRSHS